MQVILLSTLIVGLIRGGINYIDLSGGQLPVEEIRDVAAFITELSEPTDQVIAFEALWLAVESQRLTSLPGLSLAQFSYVDMVSSQANKMKLVNDEIITNYVNMEMAKLIILTDLDWTILEQDGDKKVFRQALDKKYNLVFTQSNFGHRSGTVQIFQRQ